MKSINNMTNDELAVEFDALDMQIEKDEGITTNDLIKYKMISKEIEKREKENEEYA
jgi:hypothetical protein